MENASLIFGGRLYASLNKVWRSCWSTGTQQNGRCTKFLISQDYLIAGVICRIQLLKIAERWAAWPTRDFSETIVSCFHHEMVPVSKLIALVGNLKERHFASLFSVLFVQRGDVCLWIIAIRCFTPGTCKTDSGTKKAGEQFITPDKCERSTCEPSRGGLKVER